MPDFKALREMTELTISAIEVSKDLEALEEFVDIIAKFNEKQIQKQKRILAEIKNRSN